jgi:hypothetical protein
LSDIKSRPYNDKARENFDRIFPNAKREWEKESKDSNKQEN